MLCIEMPEVTYLYGYLLVSAWVYTSDSTPTSCRSGARNRIRVQLAVMENCLADLMKKKRE
jgi:hypothetical protein